MKGKRASRYINNRVIVACNLSVHQMVDFILTVTPAEKIIFTSKKLGEESVTLTLEVKNPTKERVILKVKCTSNEMFRIRPPVTALKPDEAGKVMVTFNAGKQIPDNGKHYFALYSITSAGEDAPRKVFADAKASDLGMKKIIIDFSKDGGADEKKEEEKEEARF
uniref:Major sperm protein n=1 Tax=Rhabditophanes sp. KR3021 TaxID=114890 RepID=A0AC35UH06_9BILA